MAYDTNLEARIDTVIAKWPDIPTKKKLFGGIGYMLNGNMTFGIHGDELIVRTTGEQGEQLLRRPGIRSFQMGTRASMSGWYLATSEVVGSSAMLAELLTMSRDYVQTLPPKEK